MMGSLTSGFWHLEACPYLASWDEPLSQIAQIATTWVESEDRESVKKANVWVLLLCVFVHTTYMHTELCLLLVP